MNALETVAVVQRATVLVTEWPAGEWERVQEAMPQVARDQETSSGDWAVAVECLRREWETPRQAAERIAAYLTLHAERWGETPTLNTVRNSLMEGRG